MDKDFFEDEELRLISEQTKIAESLDRLLATFISGSVVITLYVTEYLMKDKAIKGLEFLHFSWGVYALAIILIVCNHLLSYENGNHVLKNHKKHYYQRERCIKTDFKITIINDLILIFNRSTVLYFCLGTLSILIFLCSNAKL